MNTLILATEAASSTHTGDDLGAIALVLLAIALIGTAIATVVVTPRAEPSDH